MSSDNHYDVIIIGGGLVGASMALALSYFPLSVALIDAGEWFPSSSGNGVGGEQAETSNSKLLGLSHTSYNIFKALEVWPEIAAKAFPIEHIHVSDQGHFGAVRFHAEKEGVNALGYALRESNLLPVLHARLQQAEKLIFLTETKVVNLRKETDKVVLDLDKGASVTSGLLIAADGARSTVRSLLGIHSEVKNYEQHAIVTSVTTEKPHAQTAYERFTPNGPIALLPLEANRCGVVMTVPSEEVKTYMSLNDEGFVARLQSEFGFRLGQLSNAAVRANYPLYWLRPDSCVQDNIVFIGNAAHTVHPIAAQGFNLGLRDVAQLTEAISQQLKKKQALYSHQWLRDYQMIRSKDQEHVLSFTDDLIHLFAKKLFPVVKGRTMGMLAVDLVPTLKQYLARKTMGFSGVVSRLAAGQPIGDLIYE